MTIHEAVHQLWRDNGPLKDQNVQAIGVGKDGNQDVIRVYLKQKPRPNHRFPDEYEGFPVFVRISGRMRLL